MLTKLNHVLLAGVVALVCSSCQTEKKADYQVIPLPQEVVLTQEKPFLLNKKCFHYLPRRQPLAETQR